VGAGEGSDRKRLLALPLRDACMFRPGIIVPLHGIRSKTRVYRVFYAIFRPILPVAEALFPGHVTTTEQVGRAMIAVARKGAPKPVLESRDIRALGAGRGADIESMP
jgi:hypothetical protein